MKIKFKHCRRKRIRKFLSGFHGHTSIRYSQLLHIRFTPDVSGSYLRLGHSLALFFISFGHDGAPSLPQELKKITQQLTALPLTFIVVPALR